jgi:hypothetical protein
MMLPTITFQLIYKGYRNELFLREVALRLMMPTVRREFFILVMTKD